MQEDHGLDWSWGRYCCNDSVKICRQVGSVLQYSGQGWEQVTVLGGSVQSTARTGASIGNYTISLKTKYS